MAGVNSSYDTTLDMQKGVGHSLGQLDTNKMVRRIQIVFAGFVDHTDQRVLPGEGVINVLIELSELERRRIAIVAHTDGELPWLPL